MTLILYPRPSNAHEQSDSLPPYENTKEGLKQLLLDLRSEAKQGDTKSLKVRVSKFEIPNCGAWLHDMYDSDKADSWMGQCDPAKLDENERSMREFLVKISKRDGDFFVRKVNDDPEPGHGMEWGWLQAIHHPLDIYFVSWKPPLDPRDSKYGDQVGYFFYVDGGFRWESGIIILKRSEIAATKAQFVPPQLIKKVAPTYPVDAASNHLTGVVHLTFVVGKDGAVYNLRVDSGEGLSGDPSLINAAKEAVSQWKYKPGTFNGKPINTENISATVTFAPSN